MSVHFEIFESLSFEGDTCRLGIWKSELTAISSPEVRKPGIGELNDPSTYPLMQNAGLSEFPDDIRTQLQCCNTLADFLLLLYTLVDPDYEFEDWISFLRIQASMQE